MAAMATGPRTLAGKARSSQNACTHQLTGGAAFVQAENLEEYEAHVAAQLRQYKPIAEHEVYLTHELADAMWRMRRARRYEAEILEQSLNPFNEGDEKYAVQLQRLTRYISAIERTYYRAYNELKRINAERNASTGIPYHFHGDYQKQPLDIWKTMRAEMLKPAALPALAGIQNEPAPVSQRQAADMNFMMAEYKNFLKTGKIG